MQCNETALKWNENCLSLDDNDDYWLNSKEYLRGIKKFIIAVDMDEKGKSLRDKISHRLGRYRCEFVEWKNKDANDDINYNLYS